MTRTSSALRRQLLVASLALGAAASANAWSFTWGSGETVRGDGKSAREARQPGTGFDSVRVSGPFEVRIRQAGAEKVEIEGESNLLGYVETRVVETPKGKALEIGVKRGYNLWSRQPLRVEVEMATLRGVGISGSGKTEVGAFKSAEVTFSVAGSGSVTAPQMQVDKMTLSIAGSGDISAGGRATELGVSISGSGDVRATELVAEDAKISIAGSGNAAVNANKKLKISIAGSGDVRYTGAAEVQTSVAGSGSVKRL